MSRLNFQRLLAVNILLGLLIVGCSTQPAEPTPTAATEVIVPTETATVTVMPSPTTPLPTPTDAPEIIEPVELDFSSMEGIQIYYSTTSGIESVLLPCGTENSPCSEGQELVAFSQMTTFTQIERISFFPGEEKFVFSSGDYSHNGSDDLFLYDLATGHSRRLTDTSDYNDTAWLSPDGETLALIADRNGGGHSYLHTIGRDGCCLTTIPNQLTYEKAPAWSPDGEQIAFFSEDRSQAKLFLYTVDTKAVKELLPRLSKKISGAAVWSPDGGKLAFVATLDQGADICIVDFSLNDYFCLAESKHIERLPSWSADGARLLYSAFDIEAGTEDVYQINADGTGKTQITDAGSYRNPVWVNSEFFLCENYNQGESQLILISTDGSWEQPITAQAGGVSLLKVVYP
ncbi:MAG: hypothetical protein ABFS17_13610 [Chloroflexota bacterium]